MQAENPALGIMKTGDFGDSIFYKVACQCQNSDDEINFEVEATEDDIVINTTFTPKSDYWNTLVYPHRRPSIKNSWLYCIDESLRYYINEFYHRTKVTMEVWAKGYVKMHQTTIMSEQQTLTYANTLITAVQTVKDFRENKRDTYHNEGC